MKATFLCFLVITLYAASAVPVKDGFAENVVKYPRFITFPDGNGNPQIVDLEGEVDTALIDEFNRNPANTEYFLYTRRNPTSGQALPFNNAEAIRNSNFNPNNPTVVVSHGWLGNQETDSNPTIRDAFLRKAENNVIVIDWRRLAISDYITAVNGVPAVGRGVGQFLAFLVLATGIRLDSIHIIGHSLGAHVAGNAGRELGGGVARVTALDPAGPLWHFHQERVNPNDARYVEAIHTDGAYAAGGLGIGIAVADADFYPNGGITMPGCISNYCNHNMAWRYYAATVSYNHLIAYECLTSAQLSFNACSGRAFPMGNDDLRKFGTGIYRVNTRAAYPY